MNCDATEFVEMFKKQRAERNEDDPGTSEESTKDETYLPRFGYDYKKSDTFYNHPMHREGDFPRLSTDAEIEAYLRGCNSHNVSDYEPANYLNYADVNSLYPFSIGPFLL